MSLAEAIIIGGGVSGLSAAYFLGSLGIRSVLIEKSNRLGGLIKTDYLEGCRLEAGPDSYIATKPSVAELAKELGDLGDQIISSNDAARRVYIVRSGKLVPLPQGMVMMAPAKWPAVMQSPLFSVDTKLRFIAETMAKPRKRETDISVGELVADHFGNEVLEYVADPLLAGVYGGSAATLSAGAVLPRFLGYEEQFGSLIRGVRKDFQTGPKGLFRSFRDGMQSLTDALAGSIQDSTSLVHGQAVSVRRTRGEWQVSVGDEQLKATHLICACPTYVCGTLFEESAPLLAAQLAAIPYSSAILVTMVYEAAGIEHSLNGFGFLVPQKERRTIAAATWINTKFPQRIKDGLAAIRVFIVAEEALRLLSASDQEIMELAAADLKRLMGIAAQPRFSKLYRWADSMPQYIVGHGARQQSIKQELSALPNLHLVGNAYDGVGIPDCIRLTKQAAMDISQIKSC